MVRILSVCLLLLASQLSLAADDKSFAIRYQARLEPESGLAKVTIAVAGNRLPSELVLFLDEERHRKLTSDLPIERKGNRAIIRPEQQDFHIRFDFVINNQKDSGSYDSRITDQWTILRTDKLIPSIAATARKGLDAEATLELDLPDGWVARAPYTKDDNDIFRIRDPGRLFKRPKGWLIAGKIGTRQDRIAGISTVVAGPLGKGIRRQDTLAFLSYNLPHLKQVFPDFPARLLVVIAGDPMWRGGLSGTRSLFMHADRPLISGNRTSSMIHELVHVATGIRGDRESDWIVEGLAEYYAIEILRRSGGISDNRFQDTLDELARWGEEAPSLLVRRSAAATTARAVGVMHDIDQQIRKATGGEASLDDVARELAKSRGRVTLKKFSELVTRTAGKPLRLLEPQRLTREAGGE